MLYKVFTATGCYSNPNAGESTHEGPRTRATTVPHYTQTSSITQGLFI